MPTFVQKIPSFQSIELISVVKIFETRVPTVGWSFYLEQIRLKCSQKD